MMFVGFHRPGFVIKLKQENTRLYQNFNPNFLKILRDKICRRIKAAASEIQ